MNSIPQIQNHGFLRLYQIIGDTRRGIVPIIPVSRSSWWQGIREGRFPRGVKLGSRITVWRRSDIDALLGVRGDSND
jgi:prophage regulatory protein